MRTFGWKAPHAPHRGYRASLGVTRTDIPPHVDLTRDMPPVYDQGGTGSCTANAVAGGIEYLVRRSHRDGLLPPGIEPFTPSRLAIYYGERVVEGTESDDAGALLRDGLRVVESAGFGPETLWPYDESRFAEAPSPEYQREAAKGRVINWEPVDYDLPTLCLELALGYPIAFGARVFEGIDTAADGALHVPREGDEPVGGHAMLLCGYDMVSRRFLLRNSWGVAWGRDGYGTVPFAYILDPSLTGEIHAMRAVRFHK